eukprot:3518448-Pyramimonas_sp.AAC.1
MAAVRGRHGTVEPADRPRVRIAHGLAQADGERGGGRADQRAVRGLRPVASRSIRRGVGRIGDHEP